MPILSTRTDGVIDYVVSVALIAAPYLLGFANGGPAQWVPMGLGAASLVYSLLTRYELGLWPVIPFAGHLGLDVLHGLVLASSPWVFGFAHEVYLPHLVIGLAELGVVLASARPRPERLSPA